MFSTTEGMAFVKSVLDRNGLENPINATILSRFFRYAGAQESVNVYFSQTLASNNAKQLNDSEKLKLGHSKDKFIMASVFNTQPVPISEFKWYFHHQYGNCYQFNTVRTLCEVETFFGQKIKKKLVIYLNGWFQGFNESDLPRPVQYTSQTGLLNALRLFLFVGSPNDLYSLSFFNGARIFIHNRTETPSVTSKLSK